MYPRLKSKSSEELGRKAVDVGWQETDLEEGRAAPFHASLGGAGVPLGARTWAPNPEVCGFAPVNGRGYNSSKRVRCLFTTHLPQ